MTVALLIDDDERLAPLLRKFLSQHNIQLINETHPYKGIKTLEKMNIDILILDIMLPDIDGFEVCREIRKTSDIPIVMLTGRGEAMDRVIGLEMGANDYLVKPYEPRELLLRMKNLLKMANHTVSTNFIIKHGLLEIDKEHDIYKLDNTKLSLTEKEKSLLLLLVQHAGKIVSRGEIAKYLVGIDNDLYSRSIDILISRLRQKLIPHDCINTVWGKGYKFIPPV